MKTIPIHPPKTSKYLPVYLILISLFVNGELAVAQWSTTGTNIYNTNTGNVGVGTSTPGVKLDVYGTVRSYSQLLTTAVGTNGGYYADDGVGSTIFSISRQPSNEARFQSYGFHTFYSGGNTGTEKVRIDPYGNVGIGTSTPAFTLDVYGFGSRTRNPSTTLNSYTTFKTTGPRLYEWT